MWEGGGELRIWCGAPAGEGRRIGGPRWQWGRRGAWWGSGAVKGRRWLHVADSSSRAEHAVSGALHPVVLRALAHATPPPQAHFRAWHQPAAGPSPPPPHPPPPPSERYPADLKFVGMMQYDGDLLLPKTYLVPPPEIKGVSGEYLVKNGITTFACSEVGAGPLGGPGACSLRLAAARCVGPERGQRANPCAGPLQLPRRGALASTPPLPSPPPARQPAAHPRPRSLATSPSSGTATAAATSTAPRRPTWRSPRTT
jgi:hypothetical protein